MSSPTDPARSLRTLCSRLLAVVRRRVGVADPASMTSAERRQAAHTPELDRSRARKIEQNAAFAAQTEAEHREASCDLMMGVDAATMSPQERAEHEQEGALVAAWIEHHFHETPGGSLAPRLPRPRRPRQRSSRGRAVRRRGSRRTTASRSSASSGDDGSGSTSGGEDPPPSSSDPTSANVGPRFGGRSA